ncbi:MAG: hypothetical protein AAFZ65_09995 [Planctomycetota bacterium]
MSEVLARIDAREGSARRTASLRWIGGLAAAAGLALVLWNNREQSGSDPTAPTEVAQLEEQPAVVEPSEQDAVAEVDSSIDRRPVDLRLALELGSESLGEAALDQAVADWIAGSGSHPIALRRTVESQLARTGDVLVARGALRFLARSGGLSSVDAIDGWFEDADLGELAARALAANGEPGWEALARRLEQPRTRQRALEAWPADGASADLLARALPEVGSGAPEVALALLDRGTAGVRALLEALDSGQGSMGLVAIAQPRHGASVLSAAEGRTLTPAVCALLGATRAPGAEERLVGALHDSDLRAQASVALARVASGRALTELALAVRNGLLDHDRAVGMLRVEGVSDQAWLAAVDFAAADSTRSIDALAELLLEEPELERDPALGRMARLDGVPSDLRVECIEAAGSGSASELTALVREATPEGARLAARALVAVARLGDPGGLLEALAADDRAASLARRLRDAGGHLSTSGLLQITRDLRPLLPVDDRIGNQLP